MRSLPVVPAARLRPLVAGLVAGLALTGLTAPAARAADPIDTHDGTSEFTAAASCWEIKQQDPASADGVYWLQTPRMVAPERFYCDQTTDGGGWVLVARGRFGWTPYSEGMGSAAQVRDPITGTGAFEPRELSIETIDGLLDGGRMDALPDGIRLRRARDTAGASWQEVRFAVSKAPGWTWAISGGMPVTSYSFDGVRGTGGTSDSFGSDSSWNRVVWNSTSSGGNQAPGFAYGTGVSSQGTSGASSYLYRPASGTGSYYAFPFTQVWIRPRILTPQETYPTVGAQGLGAISIGALMNDRAEVSHWGVTGLGNGRIDESSPEVAALAEINGVMYVGGNFTTVLKDNNSATAVAQPYLAAFDIRTGEWLSTFRPKLNKQVKSLIGLPDGNLFVGGEFTQVNGEAKTSLATLDPRTGATSTTFTVNLENRLASGIPTVRCMKIHGNWLYLGGAFTHLTGGTRATNPVYARAAARIDLRTGTPDANWNPNMNGTVIDLWPSEQGDRVYLVGRFTASNGTSAVTGVALTTTAPAAVAVPWTVVLSYPDHIPYQQSVIEDGGKVFVGGSQHSSFVYDRNTMQKIGGAITLVGGDFQAYTKADGVVYGGNHGNNFVYTDGTTYSSVPSGVGPWTAVDSWDFTGGWSSATMAYQDQFDPILSARQGVGTWALTVDSRGQLWMGGDFTHAMNTAGTVQWSGGFARFASRDANPPERPSSLTWTREGNSSAFTWSSAIDDRAGTLTYELLVDGRVRATTTKTTVTTPDVPDGSKVCVRTRDAAGNRSITTTPITRAVSSPVDPTDTVVASGAVWRYSFEGDTTPAGWTASAFDDANWRQGAAPLGVGAAGMTTTLTTKASPRPLTAYFRTAFTLTAAQAAQGLEITLGVDDGAAVYVNGKEVSRTNLPTGTLSATTYATAAPRTTAAMGSPTVVEVPATRLVTGRNVIAVEVHGNYRTTPDMSLSLTARATAVDAPADGTLVEAGETWRYRYTSEAVAAGWTATGFDDSSFAEGAAPLGFGSTSLSTDIDVAAGVTRPVTAYFRKAVDIADPAATGGLTLSLPADDGVAVYVNGTEVGRANLPTGTLSATTYATAAPRTAKAASSPYVVTVPASLLVKGRNVIAAEVHVNYRATPDMSFDLTATAASPR